MVEGQVMHHFKFLNVITDMQKNDYEESCKFQSQTCILGAWVVPSGPPTYSDLAGQAQMGTNLNQGWTMPTAPPIQSQTSIQGVNSASALPPNFPDITNLSLNPTLELPPPTYEDATRNKGMCK